MGRSSAVVAIATALLASGVAPEGGASAIPAQSLDRSTSAASGYRITYDSQRTPKGLWSMHGDGTNQTPFKAGVFGSSWSADGRLVAFDTASPLACAFANQVGTVEVMNADGTNLRQLGTGCFPEISPDGLHVVFQAPGPNDQHGNPTTVISVASTTGSGTAPVLPGSCTAFQCQHGEFANWAGNNELVFAGDREDSSDSSLHPALWTIPSDGSSDPIEISGTEVGPNFLIGDNGLTVDPTGKTIVTTGGESGSGCSHSDLYKLPLTGGTPTLLSGAQANHFYTLPQFSQDGRMIAWGDLDNIGTCQNANYVGHVDIMPASGGTPVQISGSDNTAFDPSFMPNGLIVNSTGDAPAVNPGGGKCTTGKTLPDGSPECTLDAAIQVADASTTIHTIGFDIPGTGVPDIAITSDLPVITKALTIDGSTQPGTPSGKPGVQISRGQNATGDLLEITGGGTTIQGLVIDLTLELAKKAGNHIVGNYIGLNPSGTQAEVSGQIQIQTSSDNVIGAPGDGNVISGATTAGISIADGSANKIQGNYIGTTASGTVLPEQCVTPDAGVEIVAGKNNLIGGTVAADRNLISGNRRVGISISNTGSTGNKIEGNFIGTDAAGKQFFAFNNTLQCNNSDAGVEIHDGASKNIIGGGSAGAGNLISGNGSLGPGPAAPGVSIGDTSFHETFGNVVQGNVIGVDAAGQPLGNVGPGVITLISSNNLIGGTAPGDGNVIANNGVKSPGHGEAPGAGVTVTAKGSTGGTQILGNSIFDNKGLGIDLGGDGVTPNHPKDAGGGLQQNYPVLKSVTSSGGSTHVVGTLNSFPNSAFVIEFFSNPTCDPSGFGQGKTSLGPSPLLKVTTDANGNANIDATLPVAVASGEVVTTTATSTGGGRGQTSEFSHCVTATG